MTSPHPDGVTLNDYADGTLSKSVRAEVDEHFASCGECRATADSLRLVRSAAGRLAPIEPRRGAWDRIERALSAHGQTRRSPRWPWLAVAAVLILATLGGLKIADVRRQTAATFEAAADAPTAQSVEAELALAEQHYQKAITGLEQIANSDRGSLDPQTASTLEKSLAVVDQAISESRAALKTQPRSEPAQASLLDNFKTKIALLQETVALINDMRRAGDPGAARAVTGLTQKGS
jgi:anti-sigma factor ChrR (cupin superfamily)